MKDVTQQSEVDSLLNEDNAIVFKHNPNCPISAAAHDEMERFEASHPESPVYRVDIQASGDVSRYIGERSGIEHHSPQLILLRNGTPAWHASHFDISARALEGQL